VAEARRIVDQAAALTDLATEIARRPRGPIAIGALTTIAPLISARLRRSFEEAYPDATVTLRSGDQVELLHMLGRAEIDVALTYDLDVPSDVRFEPVIALPPHVMLPADHPMAEEDRVSLKALEREPLILLDMPLSREYFLATLHAAGVTPKVAERVRDMAVVRSLVANGFGYGLLNTGTRTMRAPDGAGLAIRPIREDLAPLALGLATKQTQQRSAIVAALFAHVHATIGRQGLPETGMPPARGTP
jgi:DNA-binding transcriptional LysR family regulator